MKKLVILFLAVGIWEPGFLWISEAVADPVPGYWEIIDESGEVRSIAHLFVEGGQLRGRLVHLILEPDEDPNPLCDQCPGEKKDRPILGLEFLWGFRSAGPGNWKEGRILDPENGKVYRAALKILAGGKKLEVFGYIRVLVKIGRRQIWQRTSPERYPELIR
jgi:hypothetical protein